MFPKLAAFIAFGALCSALPFQIRDPSRDPVSETPQETFERSDGDHNGNLSFDEFLHSDLPYEQLKRDEFDALDSNHDQTVSRAEYETHIRKEKENADDLRAEYFGQIYEQFDENFDLRLSQTEVEKIFQKRFNLKPRENFAKIFDSFDRNHDGGLDLDEYLKFDAEMPFYELEPIISTPPTPILAFKQPKMPMMKNGQTEKFEN